MAITPAIPFHQSFCGDGLTQIGMPMGGLGAGCVCLSGHGSLQDWSIRHRPATSAVADGHGSTDAAFALLHVRGRQPVTKLLEGPMPLGKIYDQGLKAQGYRCGGHEGLPRFETCRFDNGYPFGRVELSHSRVPVTVQITGFNPFIPLDDVNSSLPCAILEYTFTSRATEELDLAFSYHLSHLAPGSKGHIASRTAAMPGFGIHYTNREAADAETFGSAALGVIGHVPRIKGMWFRGGWFDGIAALWAEASAGKFAENPGTPAEMDCNDRNGGSVLVDFRLAPGQTVTIPVVLAWHFPNVYYTHGQPPAPAAPSPTAECCAPGCGCAPKPSPVKWRPFYTSQWRDAADVAGYVHNHYATLRSRTLAFRQALVASTLPPAVIDAVTSNLAILKSPTVLRQANGNVWAWEGCSCDHGCCHGSCTHVWNYAQALPHLFPKLERTLREQELTRSMDARGHVQFRSALPDGPTDHAFHAAADGQLGGIMKVYRDWQIGGDRAWLEKIFPLAARSMEYCIQLWDPEQRGLLFEPHHNTYDIEFWGPEPMCTSVYLGALSAAAIMAKEVGDTARAQRFGDLAQRGAKLMDELLFNDEYYIQRVQWRELRDQSFAKLLAESDPAKDDAKLALLRAEGPKYQYGTGCLSDGVIGAWMARLYGIDTPMNTAHLRSHLAAIHRHNFKPDLFEHACTQRPGYAIGHEPGLLLCTWPRGDKPILPFVYSDEVWTGIEYQVASHLIEENLVQQGLDIVAAARQRYDGKVRNPFNEYECGSYYARAMASYAVMISLAGFRYSAASKTFSLSPKLPARPFTTFISTASAWGTATLTADSLRIDLIEGELPIETVCIEVDGKKRAVQVKTAVKAGSPLTLPF